MTDSKKKSKDDHINVRCTKQQKTAIEKVARRDGLGTSTWLLQLGLQAVRAAREDEQT